MVSPQVPRPFKPRKPHTKSRNGCQYCRRRRIKCDEAQPECNRCVSRNQPCEYSKSEDHSRGSNDSSPSVPSQSATATVKSAASESTDAQGDSHSPLFDSFLELGLQDSGFGTPINLSLDFTTADEDVQYSCSGISDYGKAVTTDNTSLTRDLYLLDEYIMHGCQDSLLFPHIVYAITAGIPNLAAYHKGLLSSLLALGAACRCLNLLTDSFTPPASPASGEMESVVELMQTADRYHQAALEALRYDIMDITHGNPQVIHLEAIMIFPYPLARRRIIRLLTRPRHQSTPDSSMIGLDIPEDSPLKLEWMVFLRGITTVGRASMQNYTSMADDTKSEMYLIQNSNVDKSVSVEVLSTVARHAQQNLLSSPRAVAVIIGAKHPLYPVISATRASAQQKLDARIDILQKHTSRLQRTLCQSHEDTRRMFDYSASLVACKLACDVLSGMSDAIFDEKAHLRRSTELTARELNTSWLKLFAGPPEYHPDWPMRRSVILWVSCVPKEYTDLLVSPLPNPDLFQHDCLGLSQERDLSLAIKLLAWDIYAHWLAYAILIEHECWYIADLGTFDIGKTKAMLDRYSCSCGSEIIGPARSEQDYWPTSMCSIAQQLQKYRNHTPTP
ncbi:hypothetical protein LTR84_009074 [Exophiala bonariae]|uniref:Zn(2)-C6 fungal-type domain-containing protein n=1 Tax=Exophiala bonariae TaxID=1690606 RepID=A0AAV9MVP0_9EURO|nr:hypothetical protein LTR84_009074 [Exophiala bonariae]